MPSTSIYSIPYPTGSDAPNGPLQMQNLAQAVENALQGPAAVVENTVTQAVNTSTDTALTYNSALFNLGTVWSAGSPTRLTIPGSGSQLWLFFVQIEFGNGNSTGSRDIWFRVNGTGTQNYWRIREQPGTTLNPRMTTGGPIPVTGGAYVEAMFNQTSTITLTTVASMVRFGGMRVR